MISLELLLVVLSIPHIFYFYVWTQSKHFMKVRFHLIPLTPPYETLNDQ